MWEAEIQPEWLRALAAVMPGPSQCGKAPDAVLLDASSDPPIMASTDGVRLLAVAVRAHGGNPAPMWIPGPAISRAKRSRMPVWITGDEGGSIAVHARIEGRDIRFETAMRAPLDIDIRPCAAKFWSNPDGRRWVLVDPRLLGEMLVALAGAGVPGVWIGLGGPRDPVLLDGMPQRSWAGFIMPAEGDAPNHSYPLSPAAQSAGQTMAKEGLNGKHGGKKAHENRHAASQAEGFRRRDRGVRRRDRGIRRR